MPFDALNYLIGKCNYGRRITADWDRMTIKVFLSDFMRDDILYDHHRWCSLK